jgi:cyclase
VLRRRVIPILLVSADGLVKTKRFEKPRYVGDPINIIRIFNEKEVDEIIVLDIDATREGRPPNFRLIREFAAECFMPLTYGGGIHDMRHADTLFGLGVEKISIQSIAYTNPKLVVEFVKKYGSQAVVQSVDVTLGLNGRPRLYKRKKGTTFGHSFESLVAQGVDSGVGELLICDVGREGTLSGVDKRLVLEASAGIPVPVVYTGGLADLQELPGVFDSGADAVGVGALFVFHGPKDAVLITYPSQEQLNLYV